MINSQLKINRNDNPFIHFVIDNFIEKKNFEELKKNFKTLITRIVNWSESYGTQLIDNKKLDKPIFISWGKEHSDSYDQILKLSYDLPKLHDFLILLTKEDTYYRFFNFKKKLKIHKVNEKISMIDYFTKTNVKLSIKISRVQPGSGIAIHRDSSDKMLAMLLYFGFSDDIERDFGGTQIYTLNQEGQKEHSESNYPHGLDHVYFLNKNFKKIADVSPYSNRLFGFVRGMNSWHGVVPYEVTEDLNIFRDTLQINLVKHKNYSFFLNSLRKIKKKIKNL